MTIKQIIQKLKTGNREEIKLAKKELESFWRKSGKKIKPWEVFIKETKQLDEIKSIDNQAAFIEALKFPFWVLGRGHYDFIKEFIIKIIQHPSGKLRQAMIHTADYFKIASDPYVSGLKKPTQEEIEQVAQRRLLFCRFIEEIDNLLDKYERPEFNKCEFIDEMPASVYKSLQLLITNLLAGRYSKRMYDEYKKGMDLAAGVKRDFEELNEEIRIGLGSPGLRSRSGCFGGVGKESTKPKFPQWWECTWRRRPCDQDDCPICGEIKHQRQALIEQGEDPDDFDVVLEGVGKNFKEIVEMIKESAKRRGIDITKIGNIQEPPNPREFALYNEVEKWRRTVFDILKKKEIILTCQRTEAIDDLVWYTDTLAAKVYRQLCNRWHIKQDEDYGDFDYEYTEHVLKECIRILKDALSELVTTGNYRPAFMTRNKGSADLGNENQFLSLYSDLANLEKKILLM